MGSLTTVTVLGSTGSIGTQALDVIARTPETFGVYALAARSDADTIVDQIGRFHPQRVVLVDPQAAEAVRSRCPGVDVQEGADALKDLAADTAPDVVLNAVLGSAGLEATLASLDAGRLVALANKESCIAGGPLVARRMRDGGRLVPVDSEHASVHMCLLGEQAAGVRSLVLTASGGPFRGATPADLERVTPSDALRHPTWAMGPKITVDSATLMNKGLEVLEAHVLFDLGFDAIDVVCHPQSVIHCLVGFTDGSWKASLSPPDMRVPIAYALGYPNRPDWGSEVVDWTQMSDLTFEAIDGETFRLLPLAYQAGRTGGTAPAVLNASNEIAVEAFLADDLAFPKIADVVERVLTEGENAGVGFGSDDIELGDVLAADAWARQRAKALVSE